PIRVRIYYVFEARIEIASCSASGGDRHVAASRNYSIEGAAVHDKILHDGKCLGAPRLQIQLVAIFEMPHMQLANRGFPLRAMGDSVDHESTGTAYTFAAVVVERNGVFTLGGKILVEHVEHFKKGHVRI